MTSSNKFYIKLILLIVAVIFILSLIAVRSTSKDERAQRKVERNQEKAFGVEEATIFDTENSLDNRMLSDLPADKAEEYKEILLKDDFIDMTIILYSADGQEVLRKEVQDANIVQGFGSYMLYERDPVTVFKRTMIDPGGGQLVIIEQ